MRRSLLSGLVLVFALLMFFSSISFAAESKKSGPWDGFTLTPKLGYAYFGSQGSYNQSALGTTYVGSANAMLLQLNLDFGKKGGFEFAPWFAYEKIDVTVNVPPLLPISGTVTGYGLGLYLGGPFYRWEIHSAGVWYPGIGMGWRVGYLISDVYDYAIQSGLEIPLSVTWYPSAKTKIGVTLEWSNGFGATMGATVNTAGSQGSAEFGVTYGYWTNVLVGARFF